MDTNEVLNPELKHASVSFIELAALKFAVTSGFDVEGLGMYGIEAVQGGLKVTIGPVSTFKRGPRKGQTKYGPRKNCFVLLIPSHLVEAEKELFEKETGRCADCQGNGLTWSGWKKDVGNYFRPCKKCNGTGNATAQGEQAS